jgi:cell division protein FtsB
MSKRFWTLLLILALVQLLFLVLIPGERGLLGHVRTRSRIAALERSVDSLDREIRRYEQLTELLRKEDPRQIEREARRFGMSYPDEIVYEFVPGTAAGHEH